jgi:prepilin-type N-terminal cleavage/methylation domain-containing protein
MNLIFKKKKNRGFTIFELLVTITVLAILIFFLAINIPLQVKKARDAKRKADLEKIKVVLYDYFFDQNCFPKNLPNCGQSLEVDHSMYLSNFPCDPLKKAYVYQTDEEECPQWFKILTNLENTQDANIDKVGCRNGCGPECQYNYGLSSSNIRLNEDCVVVYACSPSGHCVEYEDADISQCPLVFENDSSCQDSCSERVNRCHDERGKKIPE